VGPGCVPDGAAPTPPRTGIALQAIRLLLTGLLTAVGVALPLLLAPGVPAVFRNSLLPFEVAAAAGLLAALASAARQRPALRPLLGPALLACAVAGLTLAWTFHEIPAAMNRAHFKTWAPWLAGAGLAVWILAFAVEHLVGRRLRTFTALLLGLAIAAVSLQNGMYLHSSLSGERVRAWNVFHYYVGSKYFSELSYYDLYAATLAADDDWQKARSKAKGKKRKKMKRVRDFRKITKARDQRDYFNKSRKEIVAGFDRSLISPERLEELGRDTRFMRRYMGYKSPGWHDCFKDLGYNPAPPWTVVGTPMANLVPTDSPWFWLIANSDVPLYLLALGLLWWAFGLRSTAVMLLWLNTFQINEARFTGGFLQYDWLVSVLACAALYQRGRYRWSAIALSWGAMTRVFPGFLILGIALQAALAVLRPTRDEGEGSLPPPPRLARIAEPHRLFLTAFALSCAALFVGSHLTGGGLQTWPEWVDKIGRHSGHHAVTSNQRIGVGRLVIHKPRPGHFWAQATGNRDTRIAQGESRKHLLQFIGLLLLIPALIRRRDLDALILPLFAVLLMVVLSRYYASTWALLFLLGTPPRGSPEDRSGSWATLIAGTVLLVMAAGFYPLDDRTVGYFLINYLAYGLFAALALGYLALDLRHWHRNRTRTAPPLTAPPAPPETP
jgi:hypothetical protein